jgi:hypothetical protein
MSSIRRKNQKLILEHWFLSYSDIYAKHFFRKKTRFEQREGTN